MQTAAPRALALLVLLLGGCPCAGEDVLGRLVPELEVAGERLDLGAVPLGATRRLALEVRNRGTGRLRLLGADAAEPFGTRLAPAVIEPGRTATVEVLFRPARLGAAAGTLALRSDDPARPAVAVALVGEGVEGDVDARPSVVDLRGTLVGAERSVEVVVSNLGLAAARPRLRGEGFARPDHFRLDGLGALDAAGSVGLPPRGEVVLSLVYRPLVPGEDPGRLVLETCGAGCGVEVEVQASAVDGVLVLEPPALDFGPQPLGERRTRALAVRNLGALPVEVAAVEVEGGAALGVSPAAELPRILGPGEALGVDVEFTPAGVAPFEGAVVVTGGEPGAAPLRAPVTGRGVGPRFEVAPLALDFGVARGARRQRRALLLANAGSAEVQVARLELEGDPAFALEAVPGLPARLGPGESFAVDVVHAPAREGEQRGAVHVTTAAGERVQVPLSGGRADRYCALAFQPARLDFGLLPAGFSRRLGARLANTGSDPCELLEGAFRPPLDAAFGAPSVSFPLRLEPGEVLDLPFSFDPFEARESKATFVIRTGDVAFPERPLSLVGTAARDVEVYADPPVLRLGGARPGCRPARGEVRLLNVGTVAVTLAAAGVVPGASREFAIAAPPLPRALPVGDVLRVPVSFTAADLGPEEALLALEVPGLAHAIGVPVFAEGVEAITVVDAFVQSRPDRIDVLFVVDDSCSMQDEQDALARHFGDFIAEASVREVDFRIGITTTSVDRRRGALVGPVLDPRSRDLEQAFAAQVRVGVAGSGREQGLEAALAAFRLAGRGVGANARLLRRDAPHVLVVVSDEDDGSSLRPLQYLAELERRSPAGFSSALVHGGAAGCVSLDAVADPAPRYLEFSGLSGGLDASICEDWSVTLARIGEEIFGLETGFPLSRDPDIARGLEVRVDGVVLPGDRWRYDPASRSVIIEPPPPDGVRVDVEYHAAC